MEQKNYNIVPFAPPIISIKRISILLLTFLLPSITFAYQQKSFKSEIKTVKIHKKEWPLSYPLIELSSNEQLILSFDELTTESHNYQYSIMHCNTEWNESDLAYSEYIDGFIDNPIYDYTFSFNTTYTYIHYTVSFPNENIQFKKSGNYKVIVFEDNNKEQPILEAHFSIYEKLVSIDTNVKFPANGVYLKTKQEVDFSIHHPNFDIENPLQDIKVIISQNNRPDNTVSSLKPLFIRENELVYDYNKENLFDGVNEFRWFDTRNLKYYISPVRKISYHEPFYHAELFPDFTRNFTSYFYHSDFNGRYVIAMDQEDKDPSTEADYLFVHFTFPLEAPFIDGDVYLLGELSGWNFSEENRMQYDFDTHCYRASMLLKQGFYNFLYVYKPSYTAQTETERFEGNFSETENEYLIRVYHKGSNDFYYSLIGIQYANSNRR